MKYIIIILLAISLIGCGAKTVYVETHSTDTITEHSILKITEPKLNKLVIDNPCDSLGNLKPTFFEITTPKSTLTVKSLKNALVVEEKLDSIVDKETVKERISVDTSKEVKIKTRIPSWVWYSLIVNVVLIGWTFRKFITFI